VSACTEVYKEKFLRIMQTDEFLVKNATDKNNGSALHFLLAADFLGACYRKILQRLGNTH
jgi:hypothetical protein